MDARAEDADPWRAERKRERLLAPALEVGVRIEYRLRGRFPRVPADRIHDAVSDAVLRWEGVATSKDEPPGWGWLYTVAWRNTLRIEKSDRAQGKRMASWASSRPTEVRHEAEDRWYGFAGACKEIEALLPDEEMRAVFRLRVQGVRATDAYAAALGLDAEPVDQQMLAVKRAKDRLDKLLRRSPEVRQILLPFAEDEGLA